MPGREEKDCRILISIKMKWRIGSAKGFALPSKKNV